MDLLSLFTNDTELVDYAPGDKIFEEDAPGDKMYVVIEGEVALSVRNTEISTIKTGEIVRRDGTHRHQPAQRDRNGGDEV